jgi:hypothetical protein
VGLCACSEVHFRTSEQPNGHAFNLTAALLGFDLADTAFATHQAFARRVFSGFRDFVFQRLFNLFVQEFIHNRSFTTD